MKRAGLFLAALLTAGCISPIEAIGTLQIRVKWPAERKTQVIPFFAESVQFTVTSPEGRTLGQVTAVRTDAPTTEASLILPTGTVNICGEAFSEAFPGSGSIPVARGRMEGIRIVASKDTPVKIVLAGLVGIDTAINPLDEGMEASVSCPTETEGIAATVSCPTQTEGISANISGISLASAGVDVTIDTATASSEGLILTIE